LNEYLLLGSKEKRNEKKLPNARKKGPFSNPIQIKKKREREEPMSYHKKRGRGVEFA